MNTFARLWQKFRSENYRHNFAEALLKRGVPAQIRAMRLKRGWTQKELAKRSGLDQGSISRIENPDYGQLSFETVLAVARGFDCAFVGRFVPFIQLRAYVEGSEDRDDLATSFAEDDAAHGKEFDVLPKPLRIPASAYQAPVVQDTAGKPRIDPWPAKNVTELRSLLPTRARTNPSISLDRCA